MEIQEAIKTGYYQALNGNITLSGSVVPVFTDTAIPENQNEPYIIIGTATVVQRPTDRCKLFEVQQTLDIVTATKSPTGNSDANEIANQVEAIINPDSRVDIDVTAYGYRIGDTYLTSTGQLGLKNANRYIYRVIKTYRHLTNKL